VRILTEIARNTGSVTADTSPSIVFRDCGANIMSMSCPLCDGELSLEWWADKMSDDYDGTGFALSPLTLPCGHTVSSLNDLKYKMEQGFSRFVLRAENPDLGELSPTQIAFFEDCLGCKLRVIYRHI
jgi:hypothetical protein